ncbi:MAG: TerB family tellurite resistance protein [Deltaproteobacteria bacterium]|nr:TerB family tellurite resistance protein [Deltaproteobacteria bacterium]
MSSLNIDFKTPISKLTDKHRIWFATALTAMILVDGNIDRTEAEFLVKVISIVKEENEVDRLKKFIQFKTVPQLSKPVGLDRKLAMTMLIDMVRIAVVDKDFAASEEQMVRTVGETLGFASAEVEKLVAFGFELMGKEAS